MGYKILVLSDIHSNLPALEAVLDDAIAHGPYDVKVSVGDQIGYGPFPNEVLYRLQSENFFCMAGNHEVLVRDPLLRTTNEPVQFAADHNAAELTPGNKEYITQMGTEPIIHDSGLFSLVHGSFTGPAFDEEQRQYESIYVDNEDEVALAMEHMVVDEEESSLGIVGHTHFPLLAYGYVKREDKVKHMDHNMRMFHGRSNREQSLWHSKILRNRDINGIRNGVEWHRKILLNPGSVGQPRDYCSKAAYATLEFEDEIVKIDMRQVDYDIVAMQREMTLQGFPSELIDRLEMGR